MVWVAASVVALFGLIGTVLTLLTLPGMWIMLLVALVCKLLVPDLMGWSWLIAGGVLAVLGEAVEFGASAVGAKAGGAGKPGAWGALLGGLVGGIAGTILIPIPIVGTVVGGVAGAGLCAVLLEKTKGGKTWKDSSKAGAGAAAGKLASTFLKTAISVILALVLTVGAFWPSPTDPRPLASQPGSDPGMLDAGTGEHPVPVIVIEPDEQHRETPGAEPGAQPEPTDEHNDDRPTGGEHPPE